MAFQGNHTCARHIHPQLSNGWLDLHAVEMHIKPLDSSLRPGAHAVAGPVALEHAAQAALPDYAADCMPCRAVVVAALHHGLHLRTEGGHRVQSAQYRPDA
jgi:hypothetical protein